MKILRVSKCTNKTHLYAACKRLTSDVRSHKAESGGMEKAVPCKQKPKNATAVTPTSDKIDVKTKTAIKDKKRII